MKKLLTIVLLCVTLLPARAQEAAVPASPASSNEIGVALLTGTYFQAVGLVAGGLGSLITSVSENGLYMSLPFLVPVSVEYAHWFNDRIAVGASLNADIVSFLPELAFGRISVMPDFRYRWLNLDTFKIYSKIAAGYSECFLMDPGEDGKMAIGSYKPNFQDLWSYMTGDFGNLPLGFQLSPICAEGHTGLKGLDYFCELGIGPLGFCSFGLKKCF